jgi:hypothetical protein
MAQANSIQRRLGEKSPADGSGKPICTNCYVVMSRRLLKKPDSETDLTEVIYRCPKMRRYCQSSDQGLSCATRMQPVLQLGHSKYPRFLISLNSVPYHPL